MTREIWEPVKEEFIADKTGVTDFIEETMKEKEELQAAAQIVNSLKTTFEDAAETLEEVQKSFDDVVKTTE